MNSSEITHNITLGGPTTERMEGTGARSIGTFFSKVYEIFLYGSGNEEWATLQ
jgi:hypothetical protein